MSQPEAAPARIRDKYEAQWSSAEAQLLALLEGGETDLCRLVNAGLRDIQRARPKKMARLEAQRAELGSLLDGQLIKPGSIDLQTASLMMSIQRNDLLLDACDPEVERVIELGSGWGRNLFRLWMWGGPRDAEYHAYDLTDKAQELARRVAAGVAQGPKVVTHSIDHHRLDLSHLQAAPTFAYTNYSLEQIPQVSEAWVRTVAAIPGLRRVAHIEPIGWQIPGHDWLVDAAADGGVFGWLNKRRRQRLATRIDASNAAQAEESDFNRNLYPLLRSMEANGEIRITKVLKNICCVGYRNAASLIVWEPSAAS